MANKKGSRQLTIADRIKIEALLKAKHSIREIAAYIGVHRSTIYNELKRGKYLRRNPNDWRDEVSYSPDIAQKRCDENLKMRGTQLKIGKDLAYAKYLEDRIVNDGFSPAAVLGELKAQGREHEFETTICVVTLYSYIEKGIFLRLTNKDLPVKKNKKRRYHKVKRQQSRANAGENIEKRPDEIDTREEFGHWEMDSVIGQKRSKNRLLVLTERKTRAEIIFKLLAHTAETVVSAVNELEQRWGERFKQVFKTITVDNGSEFAKCEDLEKSVLGDEKRTKLYYCHPYSSWERGSNENANKLIRRKIPKGTNFDDTPEAEIKEIENWINHYPREIHGYHTAAELFESEIAKLA